MSYRRLTPGPGYLEALCADNASLLVLSLLSAVADTKCEQTDFVTSPIKRCTDFGIETEDGQQQKLDITICATGMPPLSSDWTCTNDGVRLRRVLAIAFQNCDGVDLNEVRTQYPASYLSMCVDKFPNMCMALGPNSIIGAELLMPILEFSIAYAFQSVAKMQKLGKDEGRIVGLWPGTR